jgi:haloacid dehalogenase-like hydrolase/NUDIX domain
MAKKRAKVIKLAKFREAQQADAGIRAFGEGSGSNSRTQALLRKPRKSGRPLRHWTFKGWTAPSPFLAEMMKSPVTAPPMERGTAMLESGALAYRRLKNGEVEILLVSKKRSKRWGIPKGRVNASLSCGETAAKEAFEEAGVIGKPASDLFLYAAQQLTTAPDRCLVIEDSPAGIDAALAAGMTAIGFCGESIAGWRTGLN